MKPRLAVWKFSSCDGCQLTLLDCEDELLDIAEAVEIAYFLEATRTQREGPYDVSLVEGLDLDRPRGGAHSEDPPRQPDPDHHRRLRHGGRHPGAAQHPRP